MFSTSLEHRLPASFAAAARRIDDLRQKLIATEEVLLPDVIAFHNHFVCHTVVLLLAATGARPVRDPFQSPLDFSFSWGFVFVEDKADEDTPGGRLVVLPARLAAHIHTDYLAHLEVLARLLARVHSELAGAIQRLAAMAADHRLPFFFLLRRTSAGVIWDSVSEASIKDLRLFDWPLPLNFLRHRLANVLRQRKLCVEIIDGQLGHGEAGVESYGDESWRTWRNDLTMVTAEIDSAFEALTPAFPSGLPENLAPLFGQNFDPLPEAIFGREARRQKRERARQLARADATAHRKQLLSGRRVADLSPDDIDDIAQRLLLSTKGMPHPRGWFKYQRFMDVLERHGQMTGRRHKAKYHYCHQTVRPAFSDLAPRSAEHFVNLAQELETLVSTIRPASFRQCALLACLLLCTQSRLPDLDRLRDVLFLRNYRVIHRQGQFFVEFAEDLHASDPDVAVRRHRISPRTADLLQRARRRTTKPQHLTVDLPAPLAELAVRVRGLTGMPTGDGLMLLRALVSLVDQWNSMTLPGTVAGYLAGRHESWSLPLRTWAHLQGGAPLDLPMREEEVDDGPNEGIGVRTQKAAQDEEQVAAADAFLRKFRRQVRCVDDASLRESDDANSVPPIRRRDLVRNLHRLVREHDGRVSPTVLLLASWIAHQASRKHKGRNVAESSLFRYLAALARPFADLAYAVDVRALNADELTELYSAVLAEDRLKRNQYRYERLRQFHRWCERNFEVARPDWAELGSASASCPADAGIILEEDYLACLRLLSGDKAARERSALAPAMLLLLCYRFALRPREAFHLLRREWIALEGMTLIVVQTNTLGRTKVPVSSRRVVPLLFELKPIEMLLIDRWIGPLDAIGGDRGNLPLFCDDAGRQLDLDRASAPVRAALKAVTGNRYAILYHARHTAGCAVALALGDLDLPVAQHLPGVADPAWRCRVQALLLGYPGVSRRSPWALARYFGHARPDRARASYLHLFGDWADALIWTDASTSRRPVHGVLDLDDFPLLKRAVVPIDDLPDLVCHATLSGVIMFLRLLGRGESPDSAVSRLSLPAAQVAEWAANVDRLDRRLHLPREPLAKDVSFACRFLAHITEDGWRRLLTHAIDIDNAAIVRQFNESGLGLDQLGVLGLNMVGATRQWTPWTVEQLGLLRVLLRIWSVPADQERLYWPSKADTDGAFLQAAGDNGFTLLRCTGETAIKIDAGLEHNAGAPDLHNFGRRCAFIIDERNIGLIRNSFDWLTAGLAVILLASGLDVAQADND